MTRLLVGSSSHTFLDDSSPRRSSPHYFNRKRPPLFSGLTRRWDAEVYLAELGARDGVVFLKNGCASDFDEDCPNLQRANFEE